MSESDAALIFLALSILVLSAKVKDDGVAADFARIVTGLGLFVMAVAHFIKHCTNGAP